MRSSILAATFVVAAFAVGCAKLSDPTVSHISVPQKPVDVGGPKGDSVAGIPEAWTHKELLERLNKTGVKVRSVPTIRGTVDGAAVYLVPSDSPHQDDLAVGEAYDAKKSGIVYCQNRKSAQDARDHAGATGRGFVSGRFWFTGDAAMLAQIQKALP